MSMTFNGTNEQLSNALNHMAENRPITKAEKAIAAEAAQYIKDTSAKLIAAEEMADAAEAIIALEDDTSPFGGELQADRIERAHDRFIASIAAYRAATGAA